jgi:hypothetical protein
MSTTRAAGHPDYSSAGTSKFIPEVWSSKMAKKYYKKTILTAICNTDYEGEIKQQGDKVYIRTVPDVTIFDHQKGMVLPKQRPESPDIEMLIDKGKGWNILLDDVDKVQSDIDLLNKYTGDAAKQLDISVDASVLGAVYADADAYNCGATAGKITGAYNLGASGSPIQITKSNIIDYITYCGGVLDEQNVPDEGRWMAIPSWMAVLLKGSDLKDASMTGDPKSTLRSGLLGMIDRFVLYQSNQIGSVAAAIESSGFKSYYTLFGTKDAISFANQFTKTETLRSTDSFDTIVRGLMVYGYKVIKSDALGYLYCRK